MASHSAVFDFLIADDDADVQQRVEAVDVRALVAYPVAGRADLAVQLRRARRDVEQDGAGADPFGHGSADELRRVVRALDGGSAADGDEVVEVVAKPVGSD